MPITHRMSRVVKPGGVHNATARPCESSPSCAGVHAGTALKSCAYFSSTVAESSRMAASVRSASDTVRLNPSCRAERYGTMRSTSRSASTRSHSGVAAASMAARISSPVTTTPSGITTSAATFSPSAGSSASRRT